MRTSRQAKLVYSRGFSVYDHRSGQRHCVELHLDPSTSNWIAASLRRSKVVVTGLGTWAGSHLWDALLEPDGVCGG
jgi:hypothetical protein